jgi:hypothetical protein
MEVILRDITERERHAELIAPSGGDAGPHAAVVKNQMRDPRNRSAARRKTAAARVALSRLASCRK